MRLIATLALLLVLPSSASAAELSLSLTAADGVRYGAAHEATGRLTEGGTGLGGQAVALEVREFPFQGDFEMVDDATTAEDGSFRFERTFDRNAQLRVSAPALEATSPVATAFVFPRVQLSFRALRSGAVRFTQAYRTPPDVLLTEPTIFYVGPRTARSARERARAATRRIRPGRFTATVTIRLPRAWNGRFRFASCFRYSEGSGMGDPAASCPRRYRF